MTPPIFSALRSLAVPIAALSTAVPCAAQARPDPLDATAPVPALTYRSSLNNFRVSGDDKPVSWKEANDTAARIGGWRAYAREVRAPAPATSAPAAGAEKK